MNLTEALNVALPEIPVRSVRKWHPRIHPKVVGREHIENGEPVIIAVISGKCWIYRMSPLQWELAQLFDGKRSYEEVRDLFLEQTGVECTVQEIRDFVGDLDSQGFWYKTPLEENIILKQKLAEGRHQHAKKKSGDASYISVSGWDPDQALDLIYPRLKWLFSTWFTVLSVGLFLFMLYVLLTRWDEYFSDSIEFFNFTNKGFWDIVVFYLLACFVLFIHESGHALACKHYGGHVHDMGFHLIYFTPAFYVDSTEVWVYGTRLQRLLTVVWGAWAEMLVGVFATPIWWGTPRGSWAHQTSYTLILITGLSVVFFNWNPLIKLDGYYILTELTGIADIKEKSTAYVSSWVKRHLFRLPVEVEYIPRARRPVFVTYALLSGAYSYALLYFFARWIGNICSSYSPQWGFVATLWVAYLLFRSRIKTFGRFMKTVYLDKRERLLARLTPPRAVAAGGALLILLFAPLWRETAEGRFLLEAKERAVVRTLVAGVVTEISADEGQSVSQGALLARLRNLELESQAARTRADLGVATARATSARLQYAAFNPAEQERLRLAERSRGLSEQLSQLTLRSPLAGVVVTPRVRDRLGSYLAPGTEVAEVADLSTMRARVFLPEFEVRRARLDAPARLHLDAFPAPLDGRTVALAPVSSEIPEGLVEKLPYKGIRPPQYYAVTIELPNPGHRLTPGMAGSAKIFGSRRSIAAFVWEPIRDFLGLKIW